MVKHTNNSSAICWWTVCDNLLSNCLSVFGHFVRLALKGLTRNEHDNGYFPRLLFFQRSKKSSFPMIHFEEPIFQITLYSCGGSHFKLPNIVKKNLTLTNFTIWKPRSSSFKKKSFDWFPYDALTHLIWKVFPTGLPKFASIGFARIVLKSIIV